MKKTNITKIMTAEQKKVYDKAKSEAIVAAKKTKITLLSVNDDKKFDSLFDNPFYDYSVTFKVNDGGKEVEKTQTSKEYVRIIDLLDKDERKAIKAVATIFNTKIQHLGVERDNKLDMTGTPMEKKLLSECKTALQSIFTLVSHVKSGVVYNANIGYVETIYKKMFNRSNLETIQNSKEDVDIETAQTKSVNVLLHEVQAVCMLIKQKRKAKTLADYIPTVAEQIDDTQAEIKNNEEA